MIFRRISNADTAGVQPGIRPVWPAFFETQLDSDPPYGIVLQADHGTLAGDLSARLHPDVFGPLTAEVIQAIAGHDAGWRSGDEAQLAAIADQPPKPFPLLSGGESTPYWIESIRLAERISPLSGVIVSRHFCALAQQDPSRRSFLEEEAPRRERVERSLGIAREDLDRWTAAIGFCDILSLYLCSGATDAVEIPVAHPALAESREARRVVLTWTSARPRFSSPVISNGAAVSLRIQERCDRSPKLRPQVISWRFAE